jgi:hypothetical protein
MPRSTEASLNNAQRARQYAKANKLSYDAAYHLMIAANAADGRVSLGLDPQAPSESELSVEDAAALTAAKTALSL